MVTKVWKTAGVRILGLMFMEDLGAMHVASNIVDFVTMMATLPVPSRPGLP